jgi:hypothetical protein
MADLPDPDRAPDADASAPREPGAADAAAQQPAAPADERPAWKWDGGWPAWNTFGFEYRLGPPPIGASQDELYAWTAKRRQMRWLDGSIVGVALLVVIVLMVVASAQWNGDHRDDGNPAAAPGTLVQEVAPGDDDALPTSMSDGHGGTVTFGH